MSEKTDHTQPTADLQQQLKELTDLLKSFSDLDRHSPTATMHWLGCAIISLLRDEAFYTMPEEVTADASALLQDHFTATYKLLERLKRRAA